MISNNVFMTNLEISQSLDQLIPKCPLTGKGLKDNFIYSPCHHRIVNNEENRVWLESKRTRKMTKIESPQENLPSWLRDLHQHVRYAPHVYQGINNPSQAEKIQEEYLLENSNTVYCPGCEKRIEDWTRPEGPSEDLPKAVRSLERLKKKVDKYMSQETDLNASVKLVSRKLKKINLEPDYRRMDMIKGKLNADLDNFKAKIKNTKQELKAR